MTYQTLESLSTLRAQLECSANSDETKRRLYGYAKEWADKMVWTLRFVRGAGDMDYFNKLQKDFAPFLKAFDALAPLVPQVRPLFF